MRSNFTRNTLSFFIALSLSFTTFSALAQSAEELFRSGVNAYQKNDLDQARTQFTQALKLAPNNDEILYNLGLTEFKAKHTGLALGLWRKALAVDPSNRDVSYAIKFAENYLPQKAFTRSTDAFETFHHSFLEDTPLLSFIVINLLLFAAAGWILIRFFAQRTRAVENEEPSPPIPYIGIFFSALLIFSLIGLGAKAYDLSLERATVALEKVEVKTSPDPQATTLFELFEGLEVIVRQSSGDWLQVTQPGGLSGWVPASAVMITSGRS